MHPKLFLFLSLFLSLFLLFLSIPSFVSPLPKQPPTWRKYQPKPSLSTPTPWRLPALELGEKGAGSGCSNNQQWGSSGVGLKFGGQGGIEGECRKQVL